MGNGFHRVYIKQYWKDVMPFLKKQNSKLLLKHYTLSVISYVNKNGSSFLLLTVLLIAAYLRLHNLNDNLIFFGDSDRDVLVAKHIIADRNLTTVAPSAYGGLGFIKNSPVYYYVIAFFYLVGNSPEKIATLIAFLSIFSIFLSYLTSKTLIGERMGLGVSFFIATNPYLIEAAQQIYQPLLAIHISIISFCVLALGLKKKSVLLITVSSLLFCLLLHIHYSILTLLPVVIFITGWNCLTSLRSNKMMIIPVLIYCLLLLQWLSIMAPNSTPNKYYFFTYSISDTFSHIGPRLSEIPLRIQLFSKTILANDDWWSLLLFFIVFSASLTYSIFTVYKKQNSVIGIFTLFFINIIFTVFSPHTNVTYFAPYYFIFLFILTYLIFKLTKRSSFLLFSVFMVLTSLLWIKKTYTEHIVTRTGYSHRYYIESVSRAIMEDLISNSSSKDLFNGINQINVIDKTGRDTAIGWNSPAYWYSLEEQATANLVTISSEYNNIQPHSDSIKYYYLICNSLYADDLSFDVFCQKSFNEAVNDDYYKKLFRIYNLSPFSKKVILTPELESTFTVYRYNRLP